MRSAARDRVGRSIDYLRISITDRCNERCVYCMPGGYKGWTQRSAHLSADEIIDVVRSAAAMGFRHFRITGGEPLLRDDVVSICRGIRAVAPDASLGLSTNGLLLSRFANDLKDAGVDSVNVSLDALQPGVYRIITGGDVARVLEGIAAAVRVGFSSVKLNCVLLRGTNETEILKLAGFAGEIGTPIRFIELMPLSETTGQMEPRFLPISEVRRILEANGPLVPLGDFQVGHGPAKYFRHGSSGAVVGLIGAISDPHFCESCNKLRLTADGRVRPCLGRDGEIALDREALTAQSISNVLEAAIGAKPENHGFHGDYLPNRPMTAIGG
ncbi:MAG: GTP 3',8-cyclase MoaA [Terrimicrobiaceae bacterium]|nr:GTP 3',8-cyclase MoaA [Terrimicrobiaceae bacterium]